MFKTICSITYFVVWAEKQISQYRKLTIILFLTMFCLSSEASGKTQHQKLQPQLEQKQQLQTALSPHINTNAECATLISYDTGTNLFSKNADKRTIPSSMTKIMTTYLVFKALKEGLIDLNDKFHVSKKAWKMPGSRMFLNYNDNVRVEDLLKGAIIQSGNDACIALAEGVSGDEAIFVNYMNELAVSFSMHNTQFCNVTGLPEKNHFSTANDLALLARRLIADFPEYYHYHSEKEFTYNNIKQINRNGLIGRYGVDGIKTGYTDQGQYGIVVSAKNDEGMRLIAVINGSVNEKERMNEAKKIIQWGFNNFRYHKLFEKERSIIKLDVLYGDQPDINLVTEEDVGIILPKKPNFITSVKSIRNSNSVSNNMGNANNTKIAFKSTNKSPESKKVLHDILQEHQIAITAQVPQNIVAPVSKGELIGVLKITNLSTGEEIAEHNLYSANNANKANFVQKLVQNIELLLLK